MKRYTLFNADGSVVASVDTAQEVANLARNGMFSMDASIPAGEEFAYVTWIDQEGLTIGFPYRTRADAQSIAKKASRFNPPATNSAQVIVELSTWVPHLTEDWRQYALDNKGISDGNVVRLEDGSALCFTREGLPVEFVG